MDVHTAQALTQLGAAATGPIAAHRALLLERQQELEKLATEYALKAGLEEQKAEREIQAKQREVIETQERMNRFVTDHFEDLKALYGEPKARLIVGTIRALAAGGKEGLGKVENILKTFEDSLHKLREAEAEKEELAIKHQYKMAEIDREAAYAKERARIYAGATIEAARLRRPDKEPKPVRPLAEVVRTAIADYQPHIKKAKEKAKKGNIAEAERILKFHLPPLDEISREFLFHSGWTQAHAEYERWEAEERKKREARRLREAAEAQRKKAKAEAEKFKKAVEARAEKVFKQMERR